MVNAEHNGARPPAGANGPSLGGWSMLANSAVVELLCRGGFDWVCLDAQHGQYDDGAVREALASAEHLPAPVLVRAVANDPAVLGRYLDAGAAGVIVPLINSAAQAAAAVRACLYPPFGARSRGPFGAHRGQLLPTAEQANQRVMIGVMVETAEALNNVEEIAAVPGIGFIFVGPLDLSIDLGCGVDELAVPAGRSGALAAVVQACRRNDIGAGAFTTDPDHFHGLAEQGFTILAAATDVSLLQDAASALISTRAR